MRWCWGGRRRDCRRLTDTAVPEPQKNQYGPEILARIGGRITLASELVSAQFRTHREPRKLRIRG